MNTNLRECEDCGKSVSINAKTCPHCGMKYPTNEIRESFGFQINVVIGFVVFIAVIFWLLSLIF